MAAEMDGEMTAEISPGTVGGMMIGAGAISVAMVRHREAVAEILDLQIVFSLAGCGPSGLLTWPSLLR
jgi:hypothetical protein